LVGVRVLGIVALGVAVGFVVGLIAILESVEQGKVDDAILPIVIALCDGSLCSPCEEKDGQGSSPE
jgi:hypothetical protein